MSALALSRAAFAHAPAQIGGIARRMALAAASAAAAFALAMHGSHAFGVGSADAERAALDELEQRVSDARATLARLPGAREEAGHGRTFADAARHAPAEHWQAISEVAARSGVTLRALEPAPAIGEGAQAARSVRIAAQANFAGLVSFLQALPTLPALVVPAGMLVKRDASGLAIDATLRVFDALPPAPHLIEDASIAAADDGKTWFADPFDVAGLTATDAAGGLRLLGFLREGGRGLALFDTEQGVTARSAGQAVGTERIVRIDARGVLLAGRAGTRLLTLTEGAR